MPQSVNSMREAAIRRAKEMYARATPNTAQQIPIGNSRENESPQTEVPIEQEETLNEDFLKTFFKDKERMLIIALLVILSQEEGNNSLLFALMYLLI